MASKRDEPLSKEEQEEEEMKNELLKAGINESMNKKEMKELYETVKKSMETSFKNEISPLPRINDTKLAHNILNISEQNSVKIMSSISNKIDAASSNLSIKSSEYRLNNEESNPSLAFEKNLNTENSCIDNEHIQERNISNHFPSLQGKSNVSTNSINGSISGDQLPKAHEISKSNLERWRLNPFHFIDNKNDVSLKKPEHLQSQEKEPFAHIKSDSKIFEILCQEMSEKLDSLREHYILSDEASRNRKSQWGSPIKVATKWNGSLDKNPFVENSPGPDISTRDTLDRNTKRKALCNIGAATYDSNDENSNDTFINTKKRKCQLGKKSEEEAKKNQESQKSRTSFVSPVEMIEVDDTKDLSDSDLFDNSNLRNLRISSNRISSINTESNYEQLQYPRRVPPPNPTKKYFKGPRAKKKNIIESKNTSLKKDLFLNDEEINKTLHELNEEIDDNDCVDITDEKKISLVSTHLPNKIQTARSFLETAHIAEEQVIKAAKEARKQKEKEEELKKDELICKRLQEREDENSRRIEKERNLNERERLHLSKSVVKGITRLNFDKSRKTREDITEDLLLSGDDEPTITHPYLSNSSCPICHKSFPYNEIESHASECEEFSSEPDEISDQLPCSSRLKYECQICNTFKTYDGNNYEEHVIKCKEKAEDKYGIRI